MKLVEENMRVNLYVLGLGKAFLEDTKSTSGKRKNRWTGLHQNEKTLILQKTPSKKQKYNPQWEKIFSNYISGKGLVYIKN